MQCVVVSDIHLVPDSVPCTGKRQGDIGLVLMRRLVHRLNRFIRPDLVVVLGDLIDDPAAASAPALYQQLRACLDTLEASVIVIPGNHDLDANAFYRHMPRPLPCTDIAGVRFLTFAEDPEEPGYNARRRRHDIERMQEARARGWKGPVIALQHVPVFAAGSTDCPYNYVNADEVLTAMRDNGIGLAISGHYHPGVDLLHADRVASLAAPALCEEPFPYLLVGISRGSITVERQSLAMPPHWRLRDTHVHTPFAYCNDNMSLSMAGRLCSLFGLLPPIFTEHSGHLYFPRTDYPATCCTGGIEAAQPAHDRFGQYLQALQAEDIEHHRRGIEIDADSRGRPVMRESHVRDVPFRVGAVHYLDCLQNEACSDARAADAYLKLLETFLTYKMHVLAHPFRVFGRAKRNVPAGLEEPVLKLLKTSGTAAEVNVHTHSPSPDWIRRCVHEGVRLAFGSDAHSLYETGDFFPHMQLLREAGFNGDPTEALIHWP